MGSCLYFTELTLVYPVSRAFWPYFRLSLATVPEEIAVVVVWCGPGDPEELRRRVQVVRPRRSSEHFRRGYVMNVGIQAVTTDYTLLGDSDFLYPRIFFRSWEPSENTVLRFYVGRLTAEATGQVWGGTDWESLYANYQGERRRVFHRLYGANNPCVYPTRLLRQLGGYEEAMIGWGGEDDDLTRRTQRCGAVQKRIPVLVGHLDHEGTSDYPATYVRGHMSQHNRGILHDPARPITANPGGWGDRGLD